MANEWFFPWYALGYGGSVTVDDFNGRNIRIGGVQFSGSTELVYWSAVQRYIANKINATFEAAENEIRSTSGSHNVAIVDDTSRLLASFCQQIVCQAVETAQRMKGKRDPSSKFQSTRAARLAFAHDIELRKQSVLAFYNREQGSKQSLGTRIEKFVERNKGKLQILAATIGVLGLTFTALKLFGI